MNKEPMKEAYEAPQVRVIEVEVEKGFAVSTTVRDWNNGNSLGNYDVE